jgi:two-component system sensor histidine kinase ChiS
VLSRVGIAVAFVGAAWTLAQYQLRGTFSPIAEFLGCTEPLFQMAVLAVRAQEARAEAADLARATQHFVPVQFLRELGHDDVRTAKLGDAASRRITVLFTDIRNFTSMSERMTPAETFAFLNRCLSRIGPHVRANHGFVDKYIGDAIMALFPRTPSDAVRATLAMQAEIAAANADARGAESLALGVGIHVGEVMLGTIGEVERFEATVISDAVNLTARLESLTKQIGCTAIASAEVQADLDGGLRASTRRLGAFVVKGKLEPVTLFEIFAADHEDLRAAKARERDRFEAMIRAFEAGRCGEASELAHAIVADVPADLPARWWRDRLDEELRAEASGKPSSGGVVRLDAK